MSAEESVPFQGSRPSEPPRGPLGGGINPIGPSGPSGPATPGGPSGPGVGGGKRFCASCGKEWPAETKFCTACGSWMETGHEGEGKGGLREHIDSQLMDRKEAMIPSFIQEGPPQKPVKGRSSLMSIIIVVLCIVLIVGGVGYTFFKGPIYLLIGNFASYRGKYLEAAEWYNEIRKIKQSGTWYDKATEAMTETGVKVYGEYMDAMMFKDWIGDIKATFQGKEKATWKVYHASGGQERMVLFQEQYPVELVIKGKDQRFVYRNRKGTPSSLDENFKKSRKKSNKDSTLKKLRKSAKWYIQNTTEKINGKKCYFVVADVLPDKRGEFFEAFVTRARSPKVKDASRFEFYIGVKDKLLYKEVMSVLGGAEFIVFEYEDVEIGADIPDRAFDIPPVPLRD